MNEVTEETPQIDSLNRGLMISFGAHIALVLFFIVKAAFFTPESIDFTQAIRVDMVGLPDKVDPKSLPPKSEAKENPKPAAPEPPKPVEKVAEKKPEPKPEPKAETKTEVKLPPKPAKKEPDAVNLEKVKSQQQNALDKLKAMAALEKIKEEVAESKAKTPPGTGKANTGAQQIKGNVVSPGTSLTGLAKLQHDTYGEDLHRHIMQSWSLPEWLAKRDYKAQARVFIDSRGNILGRKIVKSSGNPNYDDEVLATIDRAAPFPAPPEKFVSLVSVDGILIGFPE
ncbi:MAG: TonB family protein [Bdellovibrio sp.]|nr:TonB family protein [Bdellovibrio sp.]